MWHGSGWLLMDHLGILDDGNTITPPDEGIPFHHRCNCRMDPPRPETDNPPVSRRLFTAGRLGGYAGSLAEETQDRCLEEAEFRIHPFDLHNRLVSPEDCPLPHCPPFDGEVFEEIDRLFNPSQHGPSVFLRKPFCDEFSLDPFINLLFLEAFHRPRDIDIRVFPGLDIPW